MDEAKFTGSYYTPKILADFLVDHIFTKYINNVTLDILEPSCGDGQFISSFFDNITPARFKKLTLDFIDIDGSELKKAIDKVPVAIPNLIYNPIEGDYLDWFRTHNKRYNVILGNPPYIRKRHMKTEQIESCEKCHDLARVQSPCINSKFKINNIWTVFMELSILSLTDDGVLCFVLPSDILQVNYAKEIRELMQHEFERVEIFAFNELIFENIQQDVVAVVAVKRILNPEKRGFSFYQVEALNDLKEPAFTEKYNNIHHTSLNKWTNYLLSPEDLDFIAPLRQQYAVMSSFCEKISAGIVTAANDFFIVDKKTLKKNGLEKHNQLSHVLLKGSMIVPLVHFQRDDLKRMIEKNSRVFFLQGPNEPKSRLSIEFLEYVVIAEAITRVHKRFKMTERENWYHVPNIWSSALLFAKRCDEFPRLIVNSENLIATDSFYRVIPKENVNGKILTFCFYNSLTLLLAEMEGRYYGGGVLELTPNEFKRLAIPYQLNITEENFNTLDNMFRSERNIEEILSFTDPILLPNLSIDQIEHLRTLRKKLVNRRHKSGMSDEAVEGVFFHELA